MSTSYNKSSRIIFPLVILASIGTVYAGATGDSKEISIFLLATGLLGGMGMFLYGMEMMSEGMKMTAGNSMRLILEKLTSNKFLALSVGAFVTMVIQSSSATTVMLVSFVNSGLLNFTQALGVILGSNIGSTVTAQIVAFKVTDYALILIAAGSLMCLFSKKEAVKNLGYVILGFGLLLSSLTTKYRDLSFVLSFGIQLWMFATPIVYPLSIVSEKYQIWFAFNPMTAVVELFRDIFFNSSTIAFSQILISLSVTLVVFIIGLINFNRMEKNFMDTI